jgi:hypothetical protein
LYCFDSHFIPFQCEKPFKSIISKKMMTKWPAMRELPTTIQDC